MLPPRRPTYRNELVCATRRYADKLSAGSMQSHNLQYAPARYVLHFFQIFKEQTPANDITTMSIEKSAMKTRPAGHHHDLLLACTALCYLQWWSWSGSNRRPTACKAAALPAELQPPCLVVSRASQTNQKYWWVWLDSNQRPPPYQDGALTN